MIFGWVVINKEKEKKDMLEEYKLYCIDDSDVNYSYFGYESDNGNWYIKRMSNTTNIILYVRGDYNLNTSWNNRVSLEYKNYSEVF